MNKIHIWYTARKDSEIPEKKHLQNTLYKLINQYLCSPYKENFINHNKIQNNIILFQRN